MGMITGIDHSPLLAGYVTHHFRSQGMASCMIESRQTSPWRVTAEVFTPSLLRG